MHASGCRHDVARIDFSGFARRRERGVFRSTANGDLFALSRANAPLRRKTADRLVADLAARAREIELDTRFVYAVKRLAVFGSYLDPAQDRLRDIDLHLDLEPREHDPERWVALLDAHLRAASARGKRFRSIVEQLRWAETEVKQYLRSQSKHLSFHPPTDAIAVAPQRVLFERAYALSS